MTGMSEKEIRRAVTAITSTALLVRPARTHDDKGRKLSEEEREREDKEAEKLTHCIEELAIQFFNAQERIAQALETLADGQRGRSNNFG